jgi:hypothetical protein
LVQGATKTATLGKITLDYPPELEGEAKALLARLPSWWADVERPLAGDVDDRLHVTFVSHAGRVADATGQPHWAAGVARPGKGSIIVAQHGPDGSRTTLETLVKHEMVHVILHRVTGGVSLPRWFHEGVAESFTDKLDFRRVTTLAEAVFGRGVPSMERLERSFSQGDARRVSVAYAASGDLVEFLRAQGDQPFRQLLLELRRGKSLEGAIVATYDRSLLELVGQWKRGLMGRFSWYPVVASGSFPFIFLLPLLLVAWTRRRTMFKEALRRLELEEILERQTFAGVG